MNRTARALAPLALSALLLAAPPGALAQPDTTAVTQHRNGGALDISFPGGTMAEFVEALKAGIPGPFNVLLRRGAADLEVPPMDLQMVSVRSAFELAIPQRGGWFEMQPDGSRINYFREFTQIGGEDHASAPVYIIDAHEWTQEPQGFAGVRAGYSPKIEIYSVQNTVRNDADVQKLLTAIDAALDLAQDKRAAELKYHPDTALLIARAAPDQLTTIERVMDQFRESNATSENERVARAIRRSEMRAELIERRADLQRAEAALHMSIEEHKELKRLLDEQRVSSLQVLEAETSMLLAESDLQAARARYEAAQEKMDALDEPARRTPTETRRYELGATTAARRVGAQIFESLDAVSGHIRSVSRNPDNSVSIDADDEGHRVMTILVRAIQHAPHWTSGSPARSAERDPSWTWVRDFWGQDFYDTLVP